ncbi:MULTISPECIES: hypothetical protein [unclassified Methanocalculus]|uniref:hypothetical protein n=1 Tax=Methanocalculus TaxID=71151 RepID=UPI00345CB8E0
MTRAIAESAIGIRTNTDISLPDAVIAASALSLHAILITRNEKDFNGVPDLVILIHSPDNAICQDNNQTLSSSPTIFLPLSSASVSAVG